METINPLIWLVLLIPSILYLLIPFFIISMNKKLRLVEEHLYDSLIVSIRILKSLNPNEQMSKESKSLATGIRVRLGKISTRYENQLAIIKKQTSPKHFVVVTEDKNEITVPKEYIKWV